MDERRISVAVGMGMRLVDGSNKCELPFKKSQADKRAADCHPCDCIVWAVTLRYNPNSTPQKPPKNIETPPNIC